MPPVVGSSLESARGAARGKAARDVSIFAPAPAKVRPGVVIRQFPGAGGFLSAGQTVRLVVATAQHGLIPNLIGSSVVDARAQLRKLRLKARISWTDGPSGTVLEQRPRAGVLWSGRSSSSLRGSGYRIARLRYREPGSA